MKWKLIGDDTLAENVEGPPARLSISLRRLSRNCRKELLKSDAYRSLRLGLLSKDQYTDMLRTQYEIRRVLEDVLDGLHGQCRVVNRMTREEKTFNLEKYVTTSRKKAELVRGDIEELTGSRPDMQAWPTKNSQLIDYILRVREVYSVALIGILYMLEETLTYAGPQIALALDGNLDLRGAGTSYLRGQTDQKSDFFEFRSSLDLIDDLQTQVNIVTASTISYDMYKYLLNPQWFARRPERTRPVLTVVPARRNAEGVLVH